MWRSLSLTSAPNAGGNKAALGCCWSWLRRCFLGVAVFLLLPWFVAAAGIRVFGSGDSAPQTGNLAVANALRSPKRTVFDRACRISGCARGVLQGTGVGTAS